MATQQRNCKGTRLLIVFAKAPVAGLVKTRIGKVAGNDQAVQIYMQMLEKILCESDSDDKWRQVVAITPESEEAWFLQRGCAVMRQQGDDLGKRLSNALSQGFKSGASQVVIVGSDIPTLARKEITEAFSLSNASTAVIGPSADGGFYLFGASSQHRLAAACVLAADIQWSTSHVLSEVEELCRRQGLPLSYLPVKKDIDTYEDWLEYKSAQEGEE